MGSYISLCCVSISNLWISIWNWMISRTTTDNDVHPVPERQRLVLQSSASLLYEDEGDSNF